MIIHFNNEMNCNKILIRKLILDFRLFNCMRHILKIRIKQCFNCNKYDHMSLTCRYDTICFWCADKHSYKNCKKTSKCAFCKKKHITSSNTCSNRKRKKVRVQRVREKTTVFWFTDSLIKISESQQMKTQTRKEGNSITENSTMKIFSLIENELKRVKLNLRLQREKRKKKYQMMTWEKQSNNKRKWRSSIFDETLQSRSMNFKVAKFKKSVKDMIQIYKKRKNCNISFQRSTRSDKALSSSVKLRENMQQQQDAQYTQEEQLWVKKLTVYQYFSTIARNLRTLLWQSYWETQQRDNTAW